MKRITAILLLTALMIFILASCNNNDVEESTSTHTPAEKVEPIDISALEIGEYVSLGDYSGLEIIYSDDMTKAEAVWCKVVEGAKILKYPEQQVSYYFNQAKAKYEYMARSKNDTYENILELLGTSEENMMSEARALTADDLIFYALLEAENIELTDTDKENNFDRYVAKFISDYGYDEQYIKENMTEEIYETMLHDKMLERLISLNEFIAA